MSERYQVGLVINNTLVMGGTVCVTRDRARAGQIAELLTACEREVPTNRYYHVLKA